MSNISIAICDDLAEERQNLAKMVRNYCGRYRLSPVLRMFSSGDELLNTFSQPGQFQLIFLDIYMPGCSGTDTARRIRAMDRDVAILFATTSQDHGLESFEIQASDYLVKPFQQAEVDRALDWCLEHIPEPQRCLSVLSEGERRELPLSSIQYIDVYGHRARIHTSREVVVARRCLDDLEEAISSRDFLRCHRCALINMNYVQGMERNDFRMSDDSLIPISSASLSQIRSQFIDWTYFKAWGQA